MISRAPRPWRRLLLMLLVVVGVLGATIALAEVFNPQIAAYCQEVPLVDPRFDVMRLEGTQLDSPTSLQFGPDNRLYVSQQNGLIQIHTVTYLPRQGYSVSELETVAVVQEIPNHNDDGKPNPTVRRRLVTGLLVAGTADSPNIYVSSSDPRIENSSIDTNSGVISRLTRDPDGWKRQDLVRGLPRSRLDHATNGLQLDAERSVLYVAQGGNTNAGAPARLSRGLPEYALSSAILAIDLTRLPELPYDLPTLDDEDRPGKLDENDPFGGNSGKNQAILVPGGPLSVFATGFRNPYDFVRTNTGFYLVRNGPNQNFGASPRFSAESGKVTNDVAEGGKGYANSLHHIPEAGYYGGHPNPTRANQQNTFNERMPQSPVKFDNPVEAHFLPPGPANGSLTTFAASTNGITVYDAPQFGPNTPGNLLTVGLDAAVRLTQLDSSGRRIEHQMQLLKGGGALFLDVVAQGRQDPFPGTIWIADYGLGNIVVLEPTADATLPTRIRGLSRRSQKAACETYLSERQEVRGVLERIRRFMISRFRRYFGRWVEVGGIVKLTAVGDNRLMKSLYGRHRFPAEIISHTVWPAAAGAARLRLSH